MKYLKKGVAFLLSAGMLVMALTGCSLIDGIMSETLETLTDETASESASASASSIDYEAASTFMDPDTVVMTIAGEDITWEAYYYLMRQAVVTVASNVGISWESTLSGITNEDGTDMTQAEYVKYYTENSLAYYRTVALFCAENGVNVTEAALAAVEETLRASYDSSEALDEALANNYISLETYLQMNVLVNLLDEVYEKLYGADGANVTDEQMAAFLEETPYYMCKHIFISTRDTDGNELSEEEVAAKQELAQSIADELKAYEGDNEGLQALFQEKIDEYNEDTGVLIYPDGYLYTSGQMVTEFQEATEALGDYEISDPVKSTYGYHVIMCLPLDYDAMPVPVSSSSSENTLRETAANALYTAAIEEIQEGMKITYTDAYEAIDLAEIFIYG